LYITITLCSANATVWIMKTGECTIVIDLLSFSQIGIDFEVFIPSLETSGKVKRQ